MTGCSLTPVELTTVVVAAELARCPAPQPDELGLQRVSTAVAGDDPEPTSSPTMPLSQWVSPSGLSTMQNIA